MIVVFSLQSVICQLEQFYKLRLRRNFSYKGKVRLSYGPLAYFLDIFISSKNVVISADRWQHFCLKWKHRKNMQVDPNLNKLYSEQEISQHLRRITSCLDLLLISLRGNFLSQSEPREKVPSWAKHRHFNFRAKTELVMYNKQLFLVQSPISSTFYWFKKI